MTSFVEVPQLAFDGRELPSLYINIADIITFKSTPDDGTSFEVRSLGTEGTAAVATYKTYIPLSLYIDVFRHGLTARPGVHTWSETTLNQLRGPAQERLAVAASRERAAAYPRGNR